MSTVNLNPKKSPNVLEKQGSNQWVRLNVGGTCFLTTKTTLSRDPNSFLARLIKESDLISDQVSLFFAFYFKFTFPELLVLKIFALKLKENKNFTMLQYN